MDLLEFYEKISNENNLDIIGIDLTNSHSKIPKPANTANTARLMIWINCSKNKHEWVTIENYADLFLGILDNTFSGIESIHFRLLQNKMVFPLSSHKVNGYWRPILTPIPVHCLSGQLQFKCTVQNGIETGCIESCWIATGNKKHSRVLSEIDYLELI